MHGVVALACPSPAHAVLSVTASVVLSPGPAACHSWHGLQACTGGCSDPKLRRGLFVPARGSRVLRQHILLLLSTAPLAAGDSSDSEGTSR